MKALILSLIASTATAGSVVLKPALPAPAGFTPQYFLPFTFATGFDSATGRIDGVCGYTSGAGRYVAKSFYDCSWDLHGAATLGNLICSGVYNCSAPKGPVYVGLQYFVLYPGKPAWPVFVIASDANGDVLGVVDSLPYQAVLLTP